MIAISVIQNNDLMGLNAILCIFSV